MLAQDHSYCNFGYHLILTNPTPTIMKEETPKLIEMDITSMKLYMTYEPMKLGGADFLAVMMSARSRFCNYGPRREQRHNRPHHNPPRSSRPYRSLLPFDFSATNS